MVRPHWRWQSTLEYFKEEYLEHVNDKKCRALVCKELIKYEISKKNCTGCTVCAKNCPTKAIEGDRKELHLIHQDKCVKCGMCLDVCNFDAVYKTSPIGTDNDK